jgi:hypothetical protein
VKKNIIRKAAQVAAAGLLPAAALTVAGQTAAEASVTDSCGRNFTPSKATYAVTIEDVAGKKLADGFTYPKLSLREGIIDGYSSVIWARQSYRMRGSLALDWYKSPNSNTHYKCSIFSSSQPPNGPNYTQGVLVGYNNPPGANALAFRPCEVYRTDEGSNYGWQCAAWYYF